MLLFFKKVDLINDKIIQFFKYVASFLLVFVGLLIFADVLLRGAFNKPLIGVPEIIANLVVIIAFFNSLMQFQLKACFDQILLLKKLDLN